MASLHISISEHLRHQIADGVYQPGDQLPSEHQLMEEFGVSRTTIRQAIANLIGQGLVSSHQGKGVFVTKRQKVAYSLSSPLVFLEDDMARQGASFTVTSLMAELITPSAAVQSILFTSETKGQKNTKVYIQKKLLNINGIPGALDITYLPQAIARSLGSAKHTLQHHMTFPILERHGIAIDHISAILECTHADPEISQYLDVPLGHPLLVYRHTAYNPNQQPIAYGETISRGDRFCYSLTMSRA
ncbi:GntR family transcriptional regulator [Leptolyngbya sp. AN02str]|uniref:GntR family transcriptional regulator n=1 Tax=Leptolyngbya sp. AN02str TaxID=3423363 RepID=UPI003D323F29